MHFADAIEGLLDSYNSIDIRTAAFIENNSWQSAVTVVRFRKESTDELEKIHAKLREENGIIENEIFRVSLHSYPITKWKSFRENWYKKFISLRDDYTVNIIGVGELNEEQTEPMDILNNDYVNKDWKSYCVSKHTSRTGINAKLKQHDKKAIENGFMSIQEYISTIFEIGGGMLGDQGNNMIVAPVYLRISSVEFEDKTIKINCSGIPSPLDLTVTFYELDHNKMPRNPKKRERFSYGPTGYSKSVQEFTITKELEDFSQEDYFRIRIFRKNVPVEYNSNYVNFCQTEPRFKLSDEPFLKELFRLREYYQNLRQLLEVHFSGYTIKADENTNRIYLQLCLIIEEILNYPDFSELRKNDWKPLENLLFYHQDYAEEDWEYGGRQMCADFISEIEKLFIKHGQKEFQLEPQDIKNLDATQNFIQNYQIEKKESDIQFKKYAEKAGTEFNKKLSKTGKEAKPELQSEIKPKPLSGNKRWDVFISHASEDKNDVARPFADGLIEQGLDVWYDEFSLKWGDGLMESINHGLANSLFGIVIFSPNFFKNKWPKLELEALIELTKPGEKKILPLRYQLSHDELKKLSPIISGKLSRSWDDGLDALTKEVRELVQEKKIKLS